MTEFFAFSIRLAFGLVLVAAGAVAMAVTLPVTVVAYPAYLLGARLGFWRRS